MKNKIIDLLKEKGYANTGDNRNYSIRSINNLIHCGFLELNFISYEKQLEGYGFFWNESEKVKRRTIYKITIFGKTYFGHYMPHKTKEILPWGMGEKVRVNKYSEINLFEVLCRIGRLISLNKNGFDFLKNGNCNCSKCNGIGIIPAFLHYANGICFECGGTGINKMELKKYIDNNKNVVTAP